MDSPSKKSATSLPCGS